MSDLYFNEESDYSEENTPTTFTLPFFNHFRKNTCRNESHEKETKETVVRRYSSKALSRKKIVFFSVDYAKILKYM